MRNDSKFWTRLATTLKVAAVVTVLGSVALAAHEGMPASAALESVATAPATAQADAPPVFDYFPTHYPPPSGPVEDLPPTF